MSVTGNRTWISGGGGLLWASSAEKIAQTLFPSSPPDRQERSARVA